MNTIRIIPQGTCETARLDSLNSGEYRGSHPKNTQQDICKLLHRGLGHRLVVQHRRVYETQRDTIDRVILHHVRYSDQTQTYQAKLPINATNLSRSPAPAQLIAVQTNANPARNKFFSHFTRGFRLPLLTNNPFSRMRTAGKN